MPRSFGAIVAAILLTIVVRVVVPSYVSFRDASRCVQGIVAARAGSPVATLGQLQGSGRIYLIQIGPHTAPYDLKDFARWLHEKYALDVQVLPPMTLDKTTWDSSRKQHVAELLDARVNREHPKLAEDPQAYLIAFTDESMFSLYRNSEYSFTQRPRDRSAIVSSYDMEDPFWQRIQENRRDANLHLQARIRRILLKDVAILYWNLWPNNDPGSVLSQPLNVDIPMEDIYVSDFDPEHTRWGRYEAEPCIFFSYSEKDGVDPVPGRLIRACNELPSTIANDESSEIFQVDFRLGLLIDRHTDFYIPTQKPLWFQRATRPGWQGRAAFGMSGTHNFDRQLTWTDIRQISVVQADGGRYTLRRVPSWLPILAWVKYVDTASGRLQEMRWNVKAQRFELKWYTGAVETYLPLSNQNEPLYQIGYRDSRGEEILFERDQHRKLTKLTSADNSWITLNYGTGDSVSEIHDSRGRTVKYGYDDRHQLTSVTYPSGQVFYYEYDDSQHLLRVSTAANAEAAPDVILFNEYKDGLITKQTLKGGRSFTYSYRKTDQGSINYAVVHTPDGRTYNIDMDESTSAVFARD